MTNPSTHAHKPIINWGIIGLGKIAHKFAHDLLLEAHSNLYAVASRSQEKAKAFMALYQAEVAYNDYAQLANDPNVDAIYIATPHVFHCEQTLMCLEAGKAVLCEKAFAMNEKEVRQMIEKSREKQVFLMEALWTRFIPATEYLLTLLAQNTIGDIRLVRADFGFKGEYDTTRRFYNRDLGGGSLLDIGIYPIYLSLLTLGAPDAITAHADFAATQVDESCRMFFHYKNKNQQPANAVLDSTLTTATPVEAWLHGTTGTLKLHQRFHHTEQISHYDLKNNLIETWEIPYTGNGYYHEIQEVNRCLQEGLTESPKMPLSFSLALIQTLDRVRQKIGLVYPKHDKMV